MGIRILPAWDLRKMAIYFRKMALYGASSFVILTANIGNVVVAGAAVERARSAPVNGIPPIALSK